MYILVDYAPITEAMRICKLSWPTSTANVIILSILLYMSPDLRLTYFVPLNLNLAIPSCSVKPTPYTPNRLPKTRVYGRLCPHNGGGVHDPSLSYGYFEGC